MKCIEAMTHSAQLEKTLEWDKWMVEIPFIQFPANWLVKVIPPFCGAVIRFRVIKEGFKDCDSISVYLDCYDVLGCMGGKPYWEIYPIREGTERYYLNDIEGLLKGIAEALEETEELQKKAT